MASRDRFSAELKCPECGRTGTADLSQADSYAWMAGNHSTKVDFMPEGFVRIPGGSFYGDDIDIGCSDHRVSAIVRR